MKQLVINICASENHFGAFSENCEGIYAAGDSIEDCKKDVFKAIELLKKNLPEERWPIPIRSEFEVIWRYDAQSLLFYYGKIMSISGLERITGIHQKQLWSYIHGRSKPRLQQKQKIEDSLHRFGKELTQMTIV
ncbi:MAG TPA: HicB family protein [Porphyromonadaceae bacterium]|nr:HicB family protein [Porphyromonadaceae bacterium]